MLNSQCKNCHRFYDKGEMKIIIGINVSANNKHSEAYFKYCYNCFSYISSNIVFGHIKISNIKIFNEALEFKEANEYLDNIKVLIKKSRLLE